jgi:hypothetical protein
MQWRLEAIKRKDESKLKVLGMDLLILKKIDKIFAKWKSKKT